MNDLLFWALVFILAGIPALLLTRWIVRTLERRRTDLAYKLIEAMHAERPKPDTRERLISMGKFALLLPIWPIAATALLVDLAKSPRLLPEMTFDEQSLFVAHGYLTESVTIRQAESRETISDPRGERPKQPFGYLWETWQRFLATREPGAELWAYEVPLEYSKNTNRLISHYSRGYCWVRDKKILHEFAVEGVSAKPFGDAEDPTDIRDV